MRRIVLSPALLLVSALSFAAGPGTVDLNRPGVLEQLKLNHPQRYLAVSAVLEASGQVPCKGSALQLLKTQFNVQDLECGMVVLTSFPAKRHVQFELDGTRYAALVVLQDADAAL